MFLFKSMANMKWQTEIMRFLAGKGQRGSRKVQVLSIVNVFVDSADEAHAVSSSLRRVINDKTPGESSASFKYDYDHKGKRACFLLEGDVKYINSMLKVLEQ